MKVLHIITGLGIGGAEQQLRLLLRHLPLSCEVITLTHPGPVAEGIRADGTPVTHLGMTGNRDLTALPRLTRLIRAGRYDLVHTHLYRACVYGRIAARLAGVRTVIATEHSLGTTTIEGRPLTRGTRALYRGTEKLGSATVAVSDTVAERLRAWGIPGPRIHTVPNGIDAGAFRFDAAVRAATRTRLGLPQDAFVVGGVGRLVAGKRFDLLVRAVAGRPGAQLLLAGAGPERDALLRLAAGLGAADRIHLLGETGGGDGRDPAPALPALLATVDLFVSASREETFGLAVLEALAAGLPVLYVTCPAIDDLPAADAPGARRIGAGADALAAALRQHQEAGQHRFPVPSAVGHYDIAGTAGRLAELYALAAARAARP
ncbi:glycosyltransferase [Streptomyces sp. SID13666]|uniref:glycosyltransferase n=1 Tax=unclassified Streptomyces TaxID=2593676 RepID=UPI0013C12CD4|nr:MULTISPECIES: glycosyltransferase [unclassified Streptomyces]NEA58498.1 glycosyltransferase [Streptomyces sp. SID13666]NEA72514.1 glycosyltransferase [Streptomyces sp. SID13588]